MAAKVTARQANTVTVTTSTLLFAPTNTGGKITLLRGVISADTAGVYQLQDGSGGTTVAAFDVNAHVAVPFDLSLPAGQEFGAPGAALTAGNSLYCIGPSGGKVNLTVSCVETGF